MLTYGLRNQSLLDNSYDYNNRIAISIYVYSLDHSPLQKTVRAEPVSVSTCKFCSVIAGFAHCCCIQFYSTSAITDRLD
jgi:hypothetical protein